ncbi:macrophage mannose receptor 1-like [Lytechinus variegatus]|uniref:macrophage mannose receptor 1-like n=1 Tax=Lytechinus variegatus TaxID=7654 RepID=UPI001BB171C2|nr:macrophage mannose receptor 1-like [Lytechinus variegatus]
MATLMSLVLYIVATCMTAYARAECSSPDWVCPHCTFENASTAAETSVFPIGTYLVWGCEENYAMEGPSDVIVWICGADSQWSGKPTPNCAESISTCPDPPVPAYGEVNPAGVARYRPGDTVQYTCKTGYQRMGSTHNTCGNDHSWMNAAPTCKISATVCDAGNLGTLIGTDNAMVMTSLHSCIIGDNLVNDWRSQETMTSNDAKNICRDRGNSFQHVQGELALIKTPTMQEDVRRLLNQPKAYGFDLSTYLWIGVKEGRNWKWSNVATGDSNIYRLFWADGRPSEVSGTSCISLSSSASYQWVDAPCSSSRRFICQYDGSCTGRSSEHAARLIDERRKCYWFSNSKATWSDAKTSCSSEGGSLVKVTDESLQYVLANEAANVEGAVGDWWIGGYDDVSATERAWFWVDNTRATFMSWDSNQPNNPSHKCVEVNSDMEHDWNDANCNSKRQAMCQIGIAACGDPGAPTHGSRSPGDRSTYLDGAVMRFHCDPGYDLLGNSEITCQPNGEWDNAKPSCTGENVQVQGLRSILGCETQN